MNDLQVLLYIRVGPEGLSLVDGETRESLSVPPSFWRNLAQNLRSVGYPRLAQTLETLAEAQTMRVLEEKLRCMEPAVTPEECVRCQELLAEDLR